MKTLNEFLNEAKLPSSVPGISKKFGKFMSKDRARTTQGAWMGRTSESTAKKIIKMVEADSRFNKLSDSMWSSQEISIVVEIFASAIAGKWSIRVRKGHTPSYGNLNNT